MLKCNLESNSALPKTIYDMMRAARLICKPAEMIDAKKYFPISSMNDYHEVQRRLRENAKDIAVIYQKYL
jgi:hypothetical protein